MNLIIWAWLALAEWPCAFALYYTVVKEVFQPPAVLRNDSYFGYSITYDGYNKKLIISAPRENNIGEVYTCNVGQDIRSSRTCEPIVKNIVKRILPSTYEHDYWFGATVKAGRDFVMMCAPRYLARFEFHKSFGTKGRCFSYANGNLRMIPTITELERRENSPSLLEATMDSFGWSIDIAEENGSIMVGGPGMYRGRAMVYKNIKDRTPALIQNNSITSQFNFGYAVASGSFISGKLSYAVGSTYGTGNNGEVAFYDERLNFIVDASLKTSEIGSMFGAVLCAAKLVGKRTDLIVGAPTYATKSTYNLGAVYVYLALRIDKAPAFKRKIIGPVSKAMFGSAIVNVGDLNFDGIPEIVIGAPFEDDIGAVYVYSGADLISDLTDNSLKPLQKIKPEASYGESFGMSLTPLLDYDGNGCNELAIGSPFKDTVVLLRCMAAVVVKTTVKFPTLQNRTKTDFDFTVCLSVTYPMLPKKITALVSTTVEMDHDYAKLLGTDDSGRFSFTTALNDKQSQYCRYVPFTLPVDGKYETKISYVISSTLDKDPRTLPVFDESRVILSDRSLLRIQGSLWAAECSGACMPELTLEPFVSFLHGEDPYVIGSDIRPIMEFTLFNTGDVAYEPCVRIHLVGAYVLEPPPGCVQEDDGNKRCEPPKPIRNQTNWSSGLIKLGIMYVSNLDADKNIAITMLLYNHCDKDVTKIIPISIPVKADHSGIVAKGKTDIGAIVDMTKGDIGINGRGLKHVYKIQNYGPTNWEQLQIIVTLQKLPYIRYYNTSDTHTVYVVALNSHTKAPCQFESQTENSINYLCQINSLEKKDEYDLLIPMYIMPGTLEGILTKEKNVTIMSSIQLLFTKDDYKVESINTTVMLQQVPPIPIEMMLIPVAVGILLIIIILFILLKCGFLRRKNKEALEELKTQVKRQTILRRSTMLSQAPQTHDRAQILNDVQEEHVNDPK